MQEKQEIKGMQPKSNKTRGKEKKKESARRGSGELPQRENATRYTRTKICRQNMS